MGIPENAFERVGTSLHESENIVRPSISFAKDAWRRFRQNKAAMISLIYIIVLVICSLVLPHFSQFTYYEQDLFSTNTGLGVKGHIFGTDELGRDLFVRVWYGAQISLLIGIACAIIDIVVGSIYGGISGYLGGRVDNIMMRIVDVMIGLPYLIIVILLTMILKPGITTIIIAYSTVGWTTTARLVRGQIVQLKEQEYVLAAKILGGKTWRILTKHLFPNVISILIVSLTLTIPNAIFTEAFLSYIGLGVQLPVSSWGTLANDGSKVFTTYPWLLFIPAAFISLTILSFNLLGDALRDALDPKLRK